MLSLRKSLKKNNLVAETVYRVEMLVNTVKEPYAKARRTPPRPKSTAGDPGTKKFQLALCVRAKDEGRFLPEWIAHHLGLGFEHVYVYDNGSTDKSREILQPFISAALVTFLEWPYRPAFPGCYHHFLEYYGASAEWVGFLDADEFLMERNAGDLALALRQRRGQPAIALNWRYFGSSGHREIPAGFLTENFTRGDDHLDRHVKVLAKPREILACRNSHNFFYQRLGTAITPDGRKVLGSFIAPPQDPALYINHYVYRSRQDYLRKAQAGVLDVTGQRNSRTTERADREFARHNEAEFSFPERYRTQSRRLLEQLGFDPIFWQQGSRSSSRPPTG